MALAASKTAKMHSASCGNKTWQMVWLFIVLLSSILGWFCKHFSDNTFRYFTVTLIPSLCEVNSGAYMHWMVVSPLL